MDATVVKLDSLADPVGASAQNHDLRLIFLNRIFIRGIIGGIEVGAVLSTADMDALPGLFHPQRDTAGSDVILRDFKELAQILVGKTVLLGGDQHFICREPSLI